ncbi:MAG: TIGR02996 domain-containing protein [Archangium sp.]
MDQFHEALVRSPDDEALWSVIADWHEERGDPRAELIRAHSDALIAKHRATWFPNIAANALALVWAHGFVRDAEVLDDRVSPDVLLALPSMKWVRRLTFQRPVSLGSLASLPLLSSVTVRDVSRLTATELQKLAPLGELDVPSSVLSQVRVTAWSLRLRIEDQVTERALDAMKTAFPRAKFTPQLRAQTSSFSWALVPTASAVPKFAPKNVLSLPTWAETRERGVQSDEPTVTGFGSGRALGRYASVTRCMQCASGEVLQVYSRTSSLYSHFETTSYESGEVRCLKCGSFTAFRTVFER